MIQNSLYIYIKNVIYQSKIWKRNVERKIDGLEFRIINKEKIIFIKNIKKYI